MGLTAFNLARRRAAEKALRQAEKAQAAFMSAAEQAQEALESAGESIAELLTNEPSAEEANALAEIPAEDALPLDPPEKEPTKRHRRKPKE